MNDLARDKPVVSSSGDNGSDAVDGDYHTSWSPDKSDNEWIDVDLGATHTVERVNLYWGWKIHAKAFTIDVALNNPGSESSWTTVYSETRRKDVTWEAKDRIAFEPVKAQYVRMKASDRTQDWGGYNLTAFEVPVESGATDMTNKRRQGHMPVYHGTSGMRIFTLSGRAIGTRDAQSLVSTMGKGRARGVYVLRCEDGRIGRVLCHLVVNPH
jgi:hypothetical protein